MIDIDELIKRSQTMTNISDGGSAAFFFGDYILVKYAILNKYGQARPNEEKVAIAANNKNNLGVNTPKHVVVKRVVEGEKNYCYVLQEKAKGVSFTYFTRCKDPIRHLERQKELALAPLSHYIKLAKDYCELFTMGLEPKDKNIFYDKDSGFTIIDLLDYDEKGLNKESIQDYMYLLGLMNSIVYPTRLSEFTVKDKELIEKSKIYSLQMQVKIYLALKEIVPLKYMRILLRTYDKETLDYLYKMGILKEDLTLTEEEIKEYDKYIEDIVNDSYEKIKTGKYQLWQIELNEIRNGLISHGLIESYMYKPNIQVKKEEYNNSYDYECAIKDYLIKYCLAKFYSLIVNDKTNNPYIINAQVEIENKKATK